MFFIKLRDGGWNTPRNALADFLFNNAWVVKIPLLWVDGYYPWILFFSRLKSCNGFSDVITSCTSRSDIGSSWLNFWALFWNTWPVSSKTSHNWVRPGCLKSIKDLEGSSALELRTWKKNKWRNCPPEPPEPTDWTNIWHNRLSSKIWFRKIFPGRRYMYFSFLIYIFKLFTLFDAKTTEPILTPDRSIDL